VGVVGVVDACPPPHPAMAVAIPAAATQAAAERQAAGMR
jgi:hypothetical protein